MISILDYGLGNINAFYNIYKRLDVNVKVIKNIEDLKSVRKLIIPGVGSFDWAMKMLHQKGFKSYLDDLALEKTIPILGVCIGMQIMANSSDEGKSSGLGWINAKVEKFKNISTLSRSNQTRYIVPHMGWNDVVETQKNYIYSHDSFN